ncbi:hypothetical protein K491DRAFT_727714 [Lophiostoma macrostomum CBS 122681]|uniref:Uncharacterized protein n=1 Tax=Lophiostoma macrostomum CBS 122681 TaxID=1314788 RepID=A0A6A6SYP8_9PLEO|nr:hypothetical protein K491DRAFT_727714 [Lophiostoma macrostomum CBS 122681]
MMSSLQDSTKNMSPKIDTDTPRYIYAVMFAETAFPTTPVPYRMLACFKTWACFPMHSLLPSLSAPSSTPGAPPTPTNFGEVAQPQPQPQPQPPPPPPNTKIEVLNFSSFSRARVQENLSFVLETWPADAHKCLMLGWGQHLEDACACLEANVKMHRGIAGKPYEDPEAYGVQWVLDKSNEDGYAIGAMLRANGQINRWDVVKAQVKDTRYE